MNDNCLRFVQSVEQLSLTFASCGQATLDYWHPMDPPTTVAFANIGKCILKELPALDKDTVRQLFGMIEEAVASDDRELSEAVATGLIEAMIGSSSPGNETSRLLETFAPRSKAHALAWLSS